MSVCDNFEKKLRIVAPCCFVEVPGLRRVTVVEPVSENGADGVESRFEICGDVVSEVSGMTVVIRRCGRKFGVSDALSAEPDFMIAESADKCFARFFPVDPELFSEPGGGKNFCPPVDHVLSAGDPVCVPFSAV